MEAGFVISTYRTRVRDGVHEIDMAGNGPAIAFKWAGPGYVGLNVNGQDVVLEVSDLRRMLRFWEG